MSNEAGRELAVRSVERAIAILDLLAQGGWHTGAEVARGLNVHRSTALRLLGTLERHALVERDPRTSRYRLGRRLPQLASLVTGESALRSRARPVCEPLAAQLAAAGEAGAAHTHEELELGLDAIAAPVFGADGQVVAALDVSGPSHRLRPGSRPELDRLTKEGAADLSRRLGYRGRRAET